MNKNKLKAIVFGVLALFALAPLAQAAAPMLTSVGESQVTTAGTGGYSVTVKTDDDDGERGDDENGR